MNSEPRPLPYASLRVALVVPYYDPLRSEAPEALVVAQPAIASLARAEAARGMQVGVFQLHPVARRFMHAGASYHFVPAAKPLRDLARAVHRLKPRYAPPYYEPAARLYREVEGFRPDVMHVFGATLDINLVLARRTAQRLDVPMVVHYHGGVPPDGAWSRRLRREGLTGARRVLFTHREQASPWLESGLLRVEQVAEALETSTEIRPHPKALARARTGIRGDPACVMLGRLDAVKDPLTSLVGFALVAERRPLARLYVYSLTETLRRECEALIQALPSLQGKVEFRGRAAAAEVAYILSSADCLIQSSLREWSSLSVLEALACGATPVVSDIPAFRSLTAEGAEGRLFERGSPTALADSLLGGAPTQVERERMRRRRHFDAQLSFPALARRLEQVYAEVSPAGASPAPHGSSAPGSNAQGDARRPA